MSMSTLETVIESYTEHIFANDVLGQLVDRVNKLVASMISNGMEQDRYLISVEPKFLNSGLVFFVPFATRRGEHGRREESTIVFEVKQLSHRRVKVDCQYSNAKWLTPHVLQLWGKMLEHYEMSTRVAKETTDANQSKTIKTERTDLGQRGKSGRPNFPDDLWAWEQINIHHRPQKEVKQEWLVKIKADPKRRNNVDLDRQFKRIIRTEWGNKSGQNI